MRNFSGLSLMLSPQLTSKVKTENPHPWHLLSSTDSLKCRLVERGFENNNNRKNSNDKPYWIHMEEMVVWLLSTSILFKNRNKSFCGCLFLWGHLCTTVIHMGVKGQLAGVGSFLLLRASQGQTGQTCLYRLSPVTSPGFSFFIELDSTQVRSPPDSSREPWTFSPVPSSVFQSVCLFTSVSVSLCLSSTSPQAPLPLFWFLFLYLSPQG